MQGLDEYKKAGEIAKKVYDLADKIINPGASVLEVVETLESFIMKEAGESGGLAFPVNFSINNAAAHDTAKEGDERVIKEDDVIKLDVGVHVDGYICDSARTYYFDSQYSDLIKAVKSALDKAIKVVEVGIEVKEISEVIDSEITRFGFLPIANLTGHKVDRYKIHAGFSIPNIKNNINIELKEGDVIAIEPFAVQDGLGVVKNDVRIEIYEINNPQGSARGSKYAQLLWKEIKQKYNDGLPFSSRWLTSLKGIIKQRALQDLMNQRLINGYPVLKEKKGAVVSQWEKTVVLGEDKKIVVP